MRIEFLLAATLLSLDTIAQDSSLNSASTKIMISPAHSEYPEIAPVINDNGYSLYFSRLCHPDNLGSDDDSDIWISNTTDATSGAIHMPSPINNSLTNAVIKVTDNDKTIYIEGIYNDNGTPKSKEGISVSTSNGKGKWSVPKEIKITNFKNSNEHASYCFDHNMKVLIMSVERQGGFGKLDLYVSFRNDDGSFSTPQNMGGAINTSFNEGTPFIANDGKTLYFSSFGHKGNGSSDIFMSRRLDNTWLHWSAPVNLGPSVNSKFWDAYLQVADDGETAYFVSCDNDYLTEKIYKTTLPLKMRPLSSVKIEGIVTDSRSGIPVVSNISITSKTDSITIKSKPNGMFETMYVKSDEKTILDIKAKGYWPERRNIKPSENKKFNIKLTRLCRGQRIELENILFQRATANFESNSTEDLETLREVLLANPNLKIKVCGFTEVVGDPAKLKALSEMRAHKVKNYLTDHGINGSRISCEGYGGQKPISVGSSEADRVKNRRVEFEVTDF